MARFILEKKRKINIKQFCHVQESELGLVEDQVGTLGDHLHRVILEQ